MNPTTEAGKRLLDAGVVYRSWYPVERGAILAIEVEAVAPLEAEIARLRDALDAHHRGLTLAGDGPDKCAICAALAAAKETE